MILERLLERHSNAGTVVAVSETSVTVATSRGTVVAPRQDATAYQTGDRVRLANGQLVGRLRAAGQTIRV